MKQGLVRLLYNFGKRFMGWTLHMIMCVLLCYPVSIRIYYQQCVLFLVSITTQILLSHTIVLRLHLHLSEYITSVLSISHIKTIIIFNKHQEAFITISKFVSAASKHVSHFLKRNVLISPKPCEIERFRRNFRPTGYLRNVLFAIFKKIFPSPKMAAILNFRIFAKNGKTQICFYLLNHAR